MIEASSYYEYYTNFTLLIGFIFIIYTFINGNLKSKHYLTIPYVMGGSTFFLITFFLAFRPISYAFGDMGNYNNSINEYIYMDKIKEDSDILFEYMMFFFAKNFNAELFFFLCTLLYFIPLYLSYKKLFKNFWTVAFILSLLNFSFYGFAVNGIRNGIAAHIFLLGLTLPKRYGFLLILASIGFHSSMLIPAIGYVSSCFFKRVNWYYYLWLGCLCLSLVYSGFSELIQAIGIGGDKFNDYVDNGFEHESSFSMTGYRYDFVIFSIFPVVFSAYYIYKRRFNDGIYSTFVITYLFANSIFLLVNEIAFSNRFAYLSWFMIVPIILYPIYKLRTKKDTNMLLASSIFLIATYIVVSS